MRVNKKQWEELQEYVNYYNARAIIGTWWSLAKAIEAALGELKTHRDSEKSTTYTFNPKGRRTNTREKEERGGGRRAATRGKKAKK